MNQFTEDEKKLFTYLSALTDSYISAMALLIAPGTDPLATKFREIFQELGFKSVVEQIGQLSIHAMNEAHEDLGLPIPEMPSDLFPNE